MHFHILGVGSIGCLLAHNLRRILPTNHSISLIHKTFQDKHRLLEKKSIVVEEAGEQEQSNGYLHEVFTEASGRPLAMVKPVSTDIELDDDTPKTSPIQSLFVTLKAHHTVSAIRKLAPRLRSESTIVLLQNGMGIYEKLLSEVFRNPTQRPHFILASNTHGAFASTYFHIVHAGTGSIEFGVAPDSQGRDFEASLYDEKLDADKRHLRLHDLSPPGDPHTKRYKSLRATVAAMLLLEPLHTSWKSFSDLQLVMRRKLVVNAVINPLTALLDCRNGDLFGHREARSLLSQICDEASNVYQSQMASETQIWLNDIQFQGNDTSAIEIPPFPESLTSQSLQNEVIRVAEITKRNLSSTLHDIRKGRHTEIEFINGYLANLGKELGVPTPVNQALLNLIRLKYLMPLNIL